MKKLFFSVLAFVMFSFSVQSFGQTSIDDILNKAQEIASSGSSKGLTEVLGSAGSVLQNEFKGTDSEIKGKLLGQADALKSLIPAALIGKADLKSFGNIINRVKLLIAANRLKNALSGGRSGLAANSGKITSALNLMQSGASGIGENNQKNFEKLVGSALKSSAKLDKGGLFKNCRVKTTEKQLTRLVSLVNSAI